MYIFYLVLLMQKSLNNLLDNLIILTYVMEISSLMENA